MTPTSAPAYLNGTFATVGECRIDVLDRGFLFGDAIYEVVAVYNGKMFKWPAHFERLERSLGEVGIHSLHSISEWEQILNTLIKRAEGADLSLYLQVSRGISPRNHFLGTSIVPTVFAMAMPESPVPDTVFEKGVQVVTAEDIRWHRCDIKSTSLMSNVMLKMGAMNDGIYDTILLRDHRVTESSTANVFIVRDGILATAPKSQWILAGVTRDVLIDIAKRYGIEVQERIIMDDELKYAEEIWLSSSTKEVLPVTQIDNRPVGAGVPGKMWQRFRGYLKDLV